MPVVPFKRRRHPVDLALCVTAGATVVGVTFLSCWLLAVAHWPWAPRRIVEFFAPDPIETIEALLIGGVFALIAGAALGAAVGGAYNLLEWLLRRGRPEQPES